MGDPKGFLKVKRRSTGCRQPVQRINDFCDVSLKRPEELAVEQASRCMDCGTPFCHWGCPLGNLIPDWNDAVYKGSWEKAGALLASTNCLPEVTGRICPAPCEYSCVLGINDDAVTIKEDELSIIEKAFETGTIKPQAPKSRTGKKVAVVGSGPAGISAAYWLNRMGHSVVVFEKDDKVGGIMRYGIPDFKLEKMILDRRITLMKKEGVEFTVKTKIGKDVSAKSLLKDFDAVCLTGGSRQARDLNVEGRQLKGIHFAMEYLVQSNKRVAGEKISEAELIDAKGKKVVVIGGGDTGADCVGVANRQGASNVRQIEILKKPLLCRPKDQPWPLYPNIFKSSTSHEEGVERQWTVSTKKFIGSAEAVKKISCMSVDFSFPDENGCVKMNEVKGSEFEIEADLVLLALGFMHPEQDGPISEFGLELDARKNIKTDSDYMTSQKGVFSAGDMRRGQSLIVWALSEGMQAALSINKYLLGPVGFEPTTCRL